MSCISFSTIFGRQNGPSSTLFSAISTGGKGDDWLRRGHCDLDLGAAPSPTRLGVARCSGSIVHLGPRSLTNHTKDLPCQGITDNTSSSRPSIALILLYWSLECPNARTRVDQGVNDITAVDFQRHYVDIRPDNCQDTNCTRWT